MKIGKYITLNEDSTYDIAVNPEYKQFAYCTSGIYCSNDAAEVIKWIKHILVCVDEILDKLPYKRRYYHSAKNEDIIITITRQYCDEYEVPDEDNEVCIYIDIKNDYMESIKNILDERGSTQPAPIKSWILNTIFGFHGKNHTYVVDELSDIW